MSDESSRAYREYARSKRNLWWSIGSVVYGAVCIVAANAPRELRGFVHENSILFLLSEAGGFVAILVGLFFGYANFGAKRDAWRDFSYVMERAQAVAGRTRAQTISRGAAGAGANNQNAV